MPEDRIGNKPGSDDPDALPHTQEIRRRWEANGRVGPDPWETFREADRWTRILWLTAATLSVAFTTLVAVFAWELMRRALAAK